MNDAETSSLPSEVILKHRDPPVAHSTLLSNFFLLTSFFSSLTVKIIPRKISIGR